MQKNSNSSISINRTIYHNYNNNPGDNAMQFYDKG